MIRLRIEVDRARASFAENGNVDHCEVVVGYIGTRSEAHAALDKVLDTLGMEDENDS